MSDATIDLPAVVLRINRQWEPDLSPAQMYARTRGFWRLTPWRHAAAYAIAFAHGRIREVYRIHRWQQWRTDEIPPDPLRRDDRDLPNNSAYRYQFHGELAENTVRELLIDQPFTHAAQNPVLYLNC